ncbi:MAG: diterpene synthase [Chloroflexota bacterium]
MNFTLEQFLEMPVEQVASLVRAAGPKVAVFPINGTRRWFALEHAAAAQASSDPMATYMDIAQRRHIELYRLFFEHGVDTLLTPVYGAELLSRGDEYVHRVQREGLARLANHAEFLEFYDGYQVRVRFYGDYRKRFYGTPYEPLIALFDEVTRRTRTYERARLFFGVFASDATEAVAEASAAFYREQARVPTRRELIESYYGEYVEPVSFFLGFDKLSAFDYPLLATGEEDLYFTVAPSPYLTERQLREILYDHLYTRRAPEPDYAELGREAWGWMKSFYGANSERTLGVGTLKDGIWYPLFSVERPGERGQ